MSADSPTVFDDPEPESGKVSEPGFSLDSDPGCFRRLKWALVLDRPIAQLRELALAAGWRDESRLPAIWDLVTAEGHRLVAVPGTGRLQLRLSYLVPVERRGEIALRLAREVAAMLSRGARAR
jgi:hypothetical protein